MDSSKLTKASSGPDVARRRWQIAVLSVVMAGAAVAVQAQENADRLIPIVAPAASATCSSDISAACGATEEEMPSLAPDKFVMLGSAGLSAVAQQVELVQGRLAALRARLSHAAFGIGFGPGRLGRNLATWSQLGMRADEGGGATTLLGGGIGGFMRVEGELGTSDPNSFDPGFKRRHTALMLGGDYRFTPELVVGVALGVHNSRSNVDTSDGAQYSTANERGSSFSLYGAYTPWANGYADATLTVGRGRYATRRDIVASGTLDTAVGETSSRELAFSAGAGHGFVDGAWNWGPYGRVSYGRTLVDAFSERPNATNTHLDVREQSASSLLSGLGLQASWASSHNWGVLVPNTRLEWNHQFRRDRARTIAAAFAVVDDSASEMTVQTSPTDRDHFTLDLGLAAHFGVGRSGALNYSTVLGQSGQASHLFTAELRLEF